MHSNLIITQNLKFIYADESAASAEFLMYGGWVVHIDQTSKGFNVFAWKKHGILPNLNIWAFVKEQFLRLLIEKPC